ncbi:MAG: bacillithiol biosynthesis BshC, partial [Ignavibacteriae bacterium]|nr:bacillithiol biosynthesis BshC [Ignavibacteriota bacterium]
MEKVMLIDFAKIPGSAQLFLDYVNDFEKVKNYYNIDFRDEDSYKDVFEKIQNQNGSAIAEIIKNQYKDFNYSDKTKSNIELLKKENTIAVFTGQQLGLMGGPLYTIYKIFTTIKLTEHLINNFKEFNFVPVFWMAGDDHDFEEIANVNIVNNENEIEKIIYSDGKEPDE